MEITAAMVKELREQTGAGMMDCKSALKEADGAMDAAVDVLRTKGLADLAKKADRATNEGYVQSAVTEDGSAGALVEMNCETDFVARNADFQEFVGAVAAHVLSEAPSDLDELMSQDFAGSGTPTKDVLGEQVGKIGENMGVARFERFAVESEHGGVFAYIHGVGNIGTLVELSAATAEAAASDAFTTAGKDVAMQIAATNPVATTRDDVPQDAIAHEMEIYKAQAAESGKPEAIQEKIAEGRMGKYFKEVALVEQPFVKDGDVTVGEMLAGVGGDITIVRFTRFEITQAGSTC